jgi:hypothetical protein
LRFFSKESLERVTSARAAFGSQVTGFALPGTGERVGRVAGTLAALWLAITLVACGGSSQTAAGEPALPETVANSLADKADEIASALEGSDQCGAARLADELKHGVDEAISGGQVPAALTGELERTATELQNEVNCEDKPKEEPKHEDEGEKKGHDKQDDTTTVEGTTTEGTTVSTTTGETG